MAHERGNGKKSTDDLRRQSGLVRVSMTREHNFQNVIYLLPVCCAKVIDTYALKPIPFLHD